MHLSREQIDELVRLIVLRATKDSDFQVVSGLNNGDTIPVLHNNDNKRISYNDLLNQVINKIDEDGYITEDHLLEVLSDYVTLDVFAQAVDEIVKVTPQQLTSLQQSIARTNIGAQEVIKHGTTAYWNSVVGFIPKPGEIIIYDDYSSIEQNDTSIPVPGIKIGTGNAYVQDLTFVGQDVAERILSHINNTGIHVTEQEKQFWNNKINIIDSIQDETLQITRS